MYNNSKGQFVFELSQLDFVWQLTTTYNIIIITKDLHKHVNESSPVIVIAWLLLQV